MKIIRFPQRHQWADIVARPRIDSKALSTRVEDIMQRVRTEGNDAVMELERTFDCPQLQAIEVTDEETDMARGMIADKLYEAMTIAYGNIKRFHEAQLTELPRVETCKGVVCWQRRVGIESVGLYIPGGTAPLFSTVLMLATPAVLAGCKEIVICTPPDRNGNIHPAILVAAQMAGVKKVFKVGGSQAIAAMTYGTETIPKVDKIFGPGNRYVMEAKQQAQREGVAIDMPAGPSEVCIIADEKADAAYAAADLLSQAEHGADSQILFITDSEDMLQKTIGETEQQLGQLPRKEFARQSLENSSFVLVEDIDEAVELSNMYAPEHLIIQTQNCETVAEKITNAGSVFLGKYACESAGDYASGTNHTLPTHGFAKAYNGVNIDSFCKKITFQRITEQGIGTIGKAVEVMAMAESLEAHAKAMRIRRKNVNGGN